MIALGPITSYVPHRPPMLMIDEILEVTIDQRIVCRATIHPGCVFARDGIVHPSAMIEFVAQACAILAGVTATDGERPVQVGLLLGCREIAFAVDRFVVGDVLTITAVKTFGGQQMATFTGTVARGDEHCVTAELSVMDGALTSLEELA
jgi:predicted hotdog family 3-hydroxylacyl-ACP dehydratase